MPVWLEGEREVKRTIPEMNKVSLDVIVQGCISILMSGALSDIKVVKPGNNMCVKIILALV